MLLWCKECGKFIALRETLAEPSNDRTGFCTTCVRKDPNMTAELVGLIIKDQLERERLETARQSA